MKEQNVSAAGSPPGATAGSAPVARLTSQPLPGAVKPIGGAPVHSADAQDHQPANPSTPRIVAPMPSPNAKPVGVAPTPLPGAEKRAPGQAPAKSPAAAPNGFVHKVAGGARLKDRHVTTIATFIFAVLLPTLISAFYLFVVAKDQYASRLGFSVQREDASSALDVLGGLTQFSGSNAPDHLILYKYIKSRDMLQAVAQKVDLREAFYRPGDPFFSIDVDASIEERTAYWERMIRVYLDNSSGLLEIEVRTFTPETAQAIAVAILEESTRLLNELSDIAKSDATSYARADLDDATKRLKAAEEDLRAFRSRNQIVDPTTDFQGRMGLLNSLLAQQASALIELDLLKDSANANDPRRELAQRRIDVIGERIAAERQRISSSDSDSEIAYADLVSEYERLALEQDFAQRAYVASLASYNNAVAEAARASRYLATYLPPTLAEEAEYPQRMLSTLLIFLGLFLIWSISVLTYYSIRDRR